jgi:hypothetical protein
MHGSKYCRMEFLKDQEGKDLLLKDGKFQVMMEWERPYMEACIDALQPFGDVLEIGFGCGYSATRIQMHAPKSHTIIEYHPVVVEKARQWAKNYPNVTVIHDTWQNALPRLGQFDAIFFDDYPLQSAEEMKKLKEKTEASSSLMQSGNKLLKEVLQLFPFLHSVQYTDEELEEFACSLDLKDEATRQRFVNFLHELEKREQIEPGQRRKILDSLQNKGFLFSEEGFFSSSSHPFTFEKRGDRFFEFLEQCLKSHMKKDARFSCYLEDPVSKFENKDFFEKIITNPYLDYKEHLIPVEVPKHCDYYSADHALVMTITKREPIPT